MTDGSVFVLIEIVLVFGGFVAFALWEIRKTKKLMRRPDPGGPSPSAGHPPGQHGLHDGRGEAGDGEALVHRGDGLPEKPLRHE